MFNFPKGCGEEQDILEVDDGGVNNSNLIRRMKELAGYILHILSWWLSHQPYCNKDPSQTWCPELSLIDRWTDGVQSARLMWSVGNSWNLLLWVWQFTVGRGKLGAPVNIAMWGVRNIPCITLGLDVRCQGSCSCCSNFDSWIHQYSQWDLAAVAFLALILCYEDLRDASSSSSSSSIYLNILTRDASSVWTIWLGTLFLLSEHFD